MVVSENRAVHGLGCWWVPDTAPLSAASYEQVSFALRWAEVGCIILWCGQLTALGINPNSE